jgi:hypothetical protein
MMNSFTPGQLVYPVGERDRIAPVLVLEASPDPKCHDGAWIVTIMPMEYSTPIYNVRMHPRFWVTSPP